jgi:hypothetical protein
VGRVCRNLRYIFLFFTPLISEKWGFLFWPYGVIR